MSESCKWPNNKGLQKSFLGCTIQMGKDCIKGYHVHAFCNNTLQVGYGFHRANKFSAAREAIKNCRK